MTSSPGIGHNSRAEEGRSWRRYAWARARRELKPARIPLEIVRIRVRRAQALGLTYPQYASVLLGSGRDIVGFLFTVDGLQLRLRRRLAMPDAVRGKLADVTTAQRLALAPPEEDAAAFGDELEDVSGVAFAATSAPEETASWTAGRAAVRAALDPFELPSDAVVMIGGREVEARWSEAARLAGYLPSGAYFDEARGRGAVDSPSARA